MGLCRCSDRSLLNAITVQHLSSLKHDEFQKLSLNHSITPSPNGSRKSLTITDEIIASSDYKIATNKNKTTNEQPFKLLRKKRSASPNRDSGFTETDGKNYFSLRN